jgi:hypothetical protein
VTAYPGTTLGAGDLQAPRITKPGTGIAAVGNEAGRQIYILMVLGDKSVLLLLVNLKI